MLPRQRRKAIRDLGKTTVDVKFLQRLLDEKSVGRIVFYMKNVLHKRPLIADNSAFQYRVPMNLTC